MTERTRIGLRLLPLLGVLVLSAPVAAAEEAPETDPDERYTTLSGDEVRLLRKVWVGNKMGTMRNRFLGIRTLQNPLDVWVTQEILFQVKPDFVIETGTFHGGSAVLWAILLEHINPAGRVITVDIEDRRVRKAKNLPVYQRKVDFLLGSSTDPTIVAEIAKRVQGKKVLVILDSSHATEHVRAELDAYSPLVSMGSYIIVQDTFHGPGPAIADFLSGNEQFEADRLHERFVLTNNTNGFLKRIK
jgi:cephalosporin hydroxylase